MFVWLGVGYAAVWGLLAVFADRTDQLAAAGADHTTWSRESGLRVNGMELVYGGDPRPTGEQDDRAASETADTVTANRSH